MTTRIINDAESVWRQQRLLEFAEHWAGFYEAGAHLALEQDKIDIANHAQAKSTTYQLIACRARDVLMRASGLTVADVAADVAEANALTRQINDEPPRTLVPLVDWVRGKLGKWFPWVPDKGWQTIGFVLMTGRPS